MRPSTTTSPDEKARMAQLSAEEMEKTYGRGYKLLQRAGFTGPAAAVAAAPIKVLIRRPREGLRDDDSVGRKALGEPSTSSTTTRASPQSMSELRQKILDLFPEIRRFIDHSGGSCGVKSVFHRIVKPRVPTCDVSLFKLVLISARIPDFKLTSGDTELVLTKPRSVPGTRIECTCSREFVSVHDWSVHVYQSSDSAHSEYEETLWRALPSSVRPFCLVCLGESFTDVRSVVRHCREIGDTAHERLGRVVISTILAPSRDPVALGMDTLLLTALELGDATFPWRQLTGGAVDAFETIPFDAGPPTPIDLDYDSDAALEVVELEGDDSDVLNLED